MGWNSSRSGLNWHFGAETDPFNFQCSLGSSLRFAFVPFSLSSITLLHFFSLHPGVLGYGQRTAKGNPVIF